MTYEEAIKIIWPTATRNDEGTWLYHHSTHGAFEVHSPITFDALLAVWRERLSDWRWFREREGFQRCFWIGVTREDAVRVVDDGQALVNFTILTALALQAKEPKRG